MKKIILILFFNILLSSFIYAKKFNPIQEYILKVAYNVGKNIKCNDGLTFEKTLSAIALKESTAGENLIGDKYEDKYYYIKNGKIYFLKHYHKKIKIDNKIYKVHILKGQLKPLNKSSLGAFQIKLTTAKIVINKLYPEYKYLLNNNTKLIQKLLSNIKFSAKIAGGYLKLNYEEAKRRKMWKPYFRTISKYNGGWVNKKYYYGVIRKIRYLEKYNKKYNLFY